MQEIITHKSFYVKDAIHVSGSCCGTRSHTNIVQTDTQPYSKDRVHVWFSGELFNQNDLLNGQSGSSVSDAKVLHTLYVADPQFTFLKSIDGGYTAVLYDESDEKIHLVSDRYGRQHLYWAKYKDGLAWASELKAFTVIPDLRIEIDHEAVEEFMGIGHMLGDRTWFKGVQMMPAASRLTFDLISQNCETTRYWWWDELKPFSGNADRKELAEESGNLLIKAVEKLSYLTKDQVGIALSGGRDSRAIFAAMPQKDEPLHALTFGQPNCLDIRIAAYVVKVKKSKHHIHELTSDNWFNERLKAVWWTDGQCSLLRMNGVNAQGIKKFYKIGFNGLAGEAIAGRTRPFELENSLQYLEEKYMKMPVSPAVKDRMYRHIMESGCPEAFVFSNRFRHFSAHGLNQGEAAGTISRLPFLNNELLEFIYRIPPEYKKSARLYDTMLLLMFPRYFPDLSWQGQDTAVSSGHKVKYFWLKSRNRLMRMAAKSGFTPGLPFPHVDFANWIRSLPARQVFESVLSDPDAFYPEFVSRKIVEDTLQNHMNGENHAVMLGRYLTFELWMQQTFNNKYRN